MEKETLYQIEKKINILSKGYKKLEYLESNGKQAINTNIYIKNTDIVEVIMQDEEYSCNWENWFGAVDNQFGLNRKKEKNKIGLEIGGSAIYFFTEIFKNKTKILIDLPNKEITFNDNEVSSITQSPLSITTYPIYIFSKLKNISATSSSIDKIYDVPGSFKLYEFNVKDSISGDYRHNLIPVLDNAGKACLYDIVTEKLLYNETDTDLLYK